MSIYKVSHYKIDEISVRALHAILPHKKYMVDDFIKQIETYIEDYHAVVKSNLDIPQAKSTASKLESTANNIDKVIDDLQTLPTFGVPLLKAKASFSGLGYLPEILDHTRAELMHIRDVITWATDHIRGDSNQDALARLRTLVSNIAKVYKFLFRRIPLTKEKSEFMQIMRIVFQEINETYNNELIEQEVSRILQHDLSMKY